jgi:hypothetical protein
MARRTRTYVAFDADTDIRMYYLMKAWKANDGIDFDFNNAHDLTTIREDSGEDAIKRSLRERMNNSKIFILLVGENTMHLRKYVPYEIEIAQKANLPFIVVNLNGKRQIDRARCPLKGHWLFMSHSRLSQSNSLLIIGRRLTPRNFPLGSPVHSITTTIHTHDTA